MAKWMRAVETCRPPAPPPPAARSAPTRLHDARDTTPGGEERRGGGECCGISHDFGACRRAAPLRPSLTRLCPAPRCAMRYERQPASRALSKADGGSGRRVLRPRGGTRCQQYPLVQTANRRGRPFARRQVVVGRGAACSRLSHARQYAPPPPSSAHTLSPRRELPVIRASPCVMTLVARHGHVYVRRHPLPW